MKKRLKNIFHAISTPPRRFWEALTTPHASVTEVGARRQAQFLAVLSFLILVLLVLQILAALARRDMALASILFILLLLVAVTYALSRSPRPHFGSILLVYGFVGFAFVLSLRENSNITVIMRSDGLAIRSLIETVACQRLIARRKYVLLEDPLL